MHVTRQQAWDASDYASNAAFVPALGQPVVSLLAPRAGERILDLGCGDGALTAVLVQAGADVLGLDASAELLEAAGARGLSVLKGDAECLAFDGEFDAVFSNAVLHWVKDHASMLRGVHRALKPGGRFVGEFGGHGNMAAVCTALSAAARRRGIELVFPWVFPTVDEFARALSAHGFVSRSVELIARPTPLPSGMAAWLHTFAGSILAQFPDEPSAPLVEELLASLRFSLEAASGQWSADYVRLRFAAVRAD
jgi:SAM-dependent methyltransferase